MYRLDRCKKFLKSEHVSWNNHIAWGTECMEGRRCWQLTQNHCFAEGRSGRKRLNRGEDLRPGTRTPETQETLDSRSLGATTTFYWQSGRGYFNTFNDFPSESLLDLQRSPPLSANPHTVYSSLLFTLSFHLPFFSHFFWFLCRNWNLTFPVKLSC